MFDEAEDIHPLFAGAPSTTEFKKLRKRIVRQTREAIEHYGMVDRSTEGDNTFGGWSACPVAKTATPCLQCFMS